LSSKGETDAGISSDAPVGMSSEGEEDVPF